MSTRDCSTVRLSSSTHALSVTVYALLLASGVVTILGLAGSPSVQRSLTPLAQGFWEAVYFLGPALALAGAIFTAGKGLRIYSRLMELTGCLLISVVFTLYSVANYLNHQGYEWLVSVGTLMATSLSIATLMRALQIAWELWRIIYTARKANAQSEYED